MATIQRSQSILFVTAFVSGLRLVCPNKTTHHK